MEVRSNLLNRLPAMVWLGMLMPSMASADPLIASHRGSVSHAPENTLAAFRWAEVVGANMIEADLRVAADGSLVVIHDNHVDRTTDGQGKVNELPLSALRQLDAGEGQSIPTFEEVLAFVRTSRAELLLDVKDAERVDADALIGAVERHGLLERVLVGSRSKALARSIKARQPAIRVLAMVSEPEDIRHYLSLEVDGVRLWNRWTRRNPEVVEEIREAGAEVWITTGDLKGRALARALGIADGIITNHPVDALSLKQTLTRGALWSSRY
jgi:glycerophosphoryl diester phosphodiesterase